MAASESRVIFSVFAGRRRFLSVLFVYVRQLLHDGVVNEVHAWDYCRVDADRQYLQTLSAPGLRIMTPAESDRTAKFPNKWKGYYAYYATALRDSDWLIKCDDDIVFLSNLGALLRYAREDGGRHHLYYPSIVNNDVAAAFQAADGVIDEPEYVVRLQPSREEGKYSRAPVSDWFNCTACAHFILNRFLDRPASFFTGCLHEWAVPARVPINFFLMAGSAVRTHFAAYQHEAFVDEPYLTALLTERTRLPSAMVTDSVAVHFSFAFQHIVRPAELLARFRALARNQQLREQLARDYGERLPNRSCRGAAPPALLRQARNRALRGAVESKRTRAEVISAAGPNAKL